MLKTYCQNCGSLNQYVSEKPNFCNKCGIKFSHALATSDTELKVDAFGVVEEVVVDDPDQTITNILKLGGLDVEIDMTNRPIGDTVGSLMGTSEEGTRPGSTTGIDEKYTMEDFEREAGSVRKQDSGNEKEET